MATERMEGMAVDELGTHRGAENKTPEFGWWRNLVLYHVKRWNCDLKAANHSPGAWYIYSRSSEGLQQLNQLWVEVGLVTSVQEPLIA
jgi:hypothetical protein